MMKFVHFINAYGGDMWVAEDRVEEYKAAGHKLAAADAVKPTEDEEPKPKQRRKTTKK
jgi:hypothetical protein